MKFLGLLFLSHLLFAELIVQSNSVIDTTTRLEWQDTAENAQRERKWRDSEVYCKTLDVDKHYDWRLPTVKELQSIVSEPQEKNLFRFIVKDSYWSRDEDGSIIDAYQVYFGNGHVSTWNKCETLHYRCVRSH